MPKFVLALSTLAFSASTFAATSLVLPLNTGGKTILNLESGFSQEAVNCAMEAAQSAGRTFVAKYPVLTVYADNVQYAQQGSVTVFKMRLSASVNGQWRHIFAAVSTTSNRTCSAGGATVLGESAD